MKVSTTAKRLKHIMQLRNLKQVDVLNLAKPYCEKYGTKLTKVDLSQYVSGKVEPGQAKLFVLANALHVSEAWLMGLDVPMKSSNDDCYAKYISADSIAFEITGRSLQHSPQIFDAICKSLQDISPDNLADYTDGTRTFNILEFFKSPDVSYNEKAKVLRRIVDMVLINTKKNTIHLFYTLNKTPREQQIDELFFNVQDLNDVNLNKVSHYSNNLLKIQKMEEEQLYLMPDAAHDRTDISDSDRTDTARKAEDDMMDDPNF
ncbi:MAG: hypothetical protein ACLVGK_04495 [Pilosibacter sp.]|jgi:transcriptional regulator with XRE-family HTH domain